MDKWLRFYEMGPALVHLTCFLTGDPSVTKSPGAAAPAAGAGAAAASSSGDSDRPAKRQKTHHGEAESKGLCVCALLIPAQIARRSVAGETKSEKKSDLPVIVSPPGGMNLRLEHTHFFAEHHEQQVGGLLSTRLCAHADQARCRC